MHDKESVIRETYLPSVHIQPTGISGPVHERGSQKTVTKKKKREKTKGYLVEADYQPPVTLEIVAAQKKVNQSESRPSMGPFDLHLENASELFRSKER